MPRKGSQQRFYDDDGYDDDYYEEDYYEERDNSASASSSGMNNHLPYSNELWACSVCTFANAEELHVCEMCGALRTRESTAHVTDTVAKGDGYRKCEPSQLAMSLFAPPLHVKVKKGGVLEQVRQGILSKENSVTSSSHIVPFKFDVPSPDDAILGAQNSKKASTPTKNNLASDKKPKSIVTVTPPELKVNKTKKAKPIPSFDVDAESVSTDSELSGEMKTVTLKDEVKHKSLPLETYKPEPWMLSGGKGSQKSLLHLVVVGHVDAGKSTLMGRILHAVGRVSQKEMHKNQKEATEMGKASFAYAWALDEGAEERARGVTITVAVAHFETPKLHIILLDAPGHRDFVPNMISGASQADAAVLVVDASAGEFEAGMGAEGREGGQTREHAQLVRSLGVSQLIVAVNKMDVAEYSQERFEEIKGVLAPFLRQCGFRDSGISWIPVSAITGENLVTSPAHDGLRSWYKGPTLVDALDQFEPPVRDVTKPLRLAVAEVVRTRSLGATGVAGKIETGALKVGTKVMVMPFREVATVKQIEQDGKARQLARAGDNIDLGLQGVDSSVLVPGGVICHPDYPVPVATRFEARILTLKISMPIISGAQVVLHIHHAKEPAVVQLTSLLDVKSGALVKRSPRCLTSNQSALVEVAPQRGVCLEEYSNFRALGRVILRSGGRTLAVGIVTRIITLQ